MGPPRDYDYRHFDGYPRPRRVGLIVFLFFVFLGVVWIDLYDVPNGLRRLACDIGVTPWHRIVRSPRFYWALPVLVAEIAIWIRLLGGYGRAKTLRRQCFPIGFSSPC